MIREKDLLFRLDTKDTTYAFRITEGYPEHLYYGRRIVDDDFSAMALKNTIDLGSTVKEEGSKFFLERNLLEYSGIGRGDYRHSPIELLMPDGTFVSDFVYESHIIYDTAYATESMPTAYGEANTLEITLADKKFSDLKLKMNYVVFEECNVICRNVELVNLCDGPVYIRKLMSMMLDLAEANYDMLTLDGDWGKEAHEHKRFLESGILVNESTVGASSNKHNPAFALLEQGADYERGKVYGFNLIYSGNHYSAAERSTFDTARVMTGINPHCFLWKLSKGEKFVTPEAVMTYSHTGLNTMMANMHSFVNEHIVRGEHKNADRPIVLNNWEATFFNFNRSKILALARSAKKLGIEMFVLDDGWFGKRNSDTAGLGDWVENRKKLPGGIRSIAKAVNRMGMKFGLWFEPECVNPDSDLYRAHPDWAVSIEGRSLTLGRNQLVLDLTRREVREYIIESVDRVLRSSNIEYVKWDYNRHISDMYSATLSQQGEFFHRYILGLYEVLDEIFNKRHPKILFESCSSGGNRFDLGMLCYSPQIWTSDNTDPIERLDIQGGIYNFYPQSTVSAHVSMAPHAQTLRDTPISTRFNVAAFGVLGYELDFGELTPAERRQVKEQIAFYKANRRIFQYGQLKKVKLKNTDEISWQIRKDGVVMAGLYQKYKTACPGRDSLSVPGLDDGKLYSVESNGQYLRIARFGGLIKHITPIYLRPDGFILRTVNKYFAMMDGKENYTVSGAALSEGINLAMQYEGSGYDPNLRILGDFGSNLYIIKEIDNG
ncbi:MAG: alpha-galactosidase [Ruminococcaceae bacterium]|nr:alpha-galactosidase [Oscillospiraceae bacterium]